jgi:cytochrome c oxidase accessory protein FixG
MTALLQPPERVLATMNQDGSRRYVRPRPARGAFWRRRRITAYVLMAVFFAIPYLRLAGKPLILLDIPHRQFTLAGTTFLPTDTLLFMLLLISAAIGIFLLTALFGRVWCGWACPQTVYMEYLFRPLEYLIEGGRAGTLTLDRARGLRPRRVAKYAVFSLLALFLAHTFLAYFVGIEALRHWVTTPPAQHPTAFFVMALTSGLVLFNFGWFREQTCLVACPYGRLQSVLLDRQSLIVGYDVARGEPRRRHLAVAGTRGDCIDCSACVQVCPTGIDIRDGLQMECIHCTQCADACDAIMDRVAKPRGLIRYTTRARLEGAPSRRLRPRVVLYPVALLIALSLLVYFLHDRRDTDVTILRGLGTPWSTLPSGIVNQVRLRIANRSAEPHRYTIRLDGGDGGMTMIAPENPLVVAAGATRTAGLFISAPRSAFHDGERHVRFVISDGAAFREELAFTLLGPEGDDDAGEHHQ